MGVIFFIAMLISQQSKTKTYTITEIKQGLTPLTQNSCTLEFPKSMTAILPSGRTATLVGRSNWPGL